MLTHIALTLLAGLPLSGTGTGTVAPAQEPNRRPPQERWERMSDEEREVMRARFEELRRLSPEEREALKERHRGLESMRERVRGRHSPEVRRELEGLEPERRRDLLREELVDEARGRGARIREKLPPEFERELEAAPPERRPQMLENFRRKQFEHRSERRLKHLAKQLELPEAERERIAGLPPEARRRELPRLEKQFVVRRVEQQGRPPAGIEPAEWERLRQLPPEDFLDEMLRRRMLGGPSKARSHGRPHAGSPEERGPGERGLGERGPGGRRPGQEMPDRQRLFELLRPGVEERLELARLPREERKRLMAERTSERALDFVEREGLVEPAEVERLRGLPGEERLEALRGLFQGRRASEAKLERGRERERPPGARKPDGTGGRRTGPPHGGQSKHGEGQRRDPAGRNRTKPR